jgi:uncharacterized membrane protein
METRARLPIHRMVIVFPLGLLGTSFLFDVAWLTTGRGDLARDAYWIMVAGVIGAAVAAVFGVLAFRAIPRGTRARRLGTLHGTGNAVVTLLFLGSLLLRGGDPSHPTIAALALSALGVLLTLFTGWLGGELANRIDEEEKGGSPFVAGTPEAKR